MGRQCGLGQAERIAQFAHTQLTLSERLHDAEAVRIRQALRDSHEVLDGG